MDLWIAFVLFVTYTLLDGLYAVYTMAIVRKNKSMAASIAAVMYALIAVGTINYIENYFYIVPMALGAWVGTYGSMYLMDKFEGDET